MRPSRIFTLAAAALAGSALVVSPSFATDGRDAMAQAAAQAAANSATPTTTPDTRFVQCDGTDSEEFPRGLVLDCVGNTAALFDANWDTWGSATAVGKSTFVHVKDANAARPDMYAVKIKAYGLSKRGTQALYTKLDVTFTSTQPAGMAKVVTYTFPTSRPRS